MSSSTSPTSASSSPPRSARSPRERARDGNPPRDIDVRTILSDKQHDRLTKAIGQSGVAFLGLAIGQYLASLTGLPIDYQIQRRTEANALHDGPRNPLGRRPLSRFKGDAQTVDMDRMLAKLHEENPSDVLDTPGVRSIP